VLEALRTEKSSGKQTGYFYLDIDRGNGGVAGFHKPQDNKYFYPGFAKPGIGIG